MNKEKGFPIWEKGYLRDLRYIGVTQDYTFFSFRCLSDSYFINCVLGKLNSHNSSLCECFFKGCTLNLYDIDQSDWIGNTFEKCIFSRFAFGRWPIVNDNNFIECQFGGDRVISVSSYPIKFENNIFRQCTGVLYFRQAYIKGTSFRESPGLSVVIEDIVDGDFTKEDFDLLLKLKGQVTLKDQAKKRWLYTLAADYLRIQFEP